MIIFFCFFLLLVFALLFAIAPRMTRKPDVSMLMGRHYAHRGLHNKTDVPENSLAAFEKAIEKDYGVELDVQLTRDRVPVVFHDETLKRACGVEGCVRDFTYAELSQFPLFASQQYIPKLEEALDLFSGRVPLIIEIKVHEDAAEVCRHADALIEKYDGPYCIESFDPRAVQWYRQNRPQVIRGQLSSSFNMPNRREKPSEFFVHYLLTNFLCRPDFIAYNHNSRRNISRRILRRCFGTLSVAWTIRSQEQLDACKDEFDLFIFEQFIPRA